MTFTSPLAEELAEDVLDRFLRYVRVDTQSSRDGEGTPSTPGQLVLSRMLVEELHAAGVEDAELDQHGYVYATIPGDPDAPVVGLLAHVDTSPDAPGAGVEPIVHRNWAGTRIELPRNGTVLDPAELENLARKEGHDIVTASGDTLLGADDKAGVAEVMAVAAYLMANPDRPRPTLRICFTPDEEIGQGPMLFDYERFGAFCAYTLDASQPGELQDETFSAAEITLTIEGVEAHPGWATGKLVNAARLAARVLTRLPSDTLTPETTADREGFVHPYELEASAGHATVRMIVRDFDDDLLEQHVHLVQRTAEEVVSEEPNARLGFEVKTQYPNMRRFVERFPQVIEVAERAIRAEGIEPLRIPIRGGTDGAILSQNGLPTPNLFTGGDEYHSAREWASVQDMASAAAVVVRLAGEWAAERP